MFIIYYTPLRNKSASPRVCAPSPLSALRPLVPIGRNVASCVRRVYQFRCTSGIRTNLIYSRRHCGQRGKLIIATPLRAWLSQLAETVHLPGRELTRRCDNAVGPLLPSRGRIYNKTFADPQYGSLIVERVKAANGERNAFFLKWIFLGRWPSCIFLY